MNSEQPQATAPCQFRHGTKLTGSPPSVFSLRSSRCSLVLTNSEELAQERPCRNYNRPMDAKTVGGLILEVYDQLKRVGRLRL
jgi:hypothetical protein